MEKIALPKYCRNWQGEMTKVEYPKGYEAIAQCGDVFLLWDEKTFGVVYGFEVKSGYTYEEAAKQFGMAVIHQAQCEGRV